MDKNKVMELVKTSKNFDEFKAGLEAGGIELTSEQTAHLKAYYPKSGKLSDDDLENVSGGGFWDFLKSLGDMLPFMNI